MSFTHPAPAHETSSGVPSLTKNVAANYVSTAYTMAAAIIMAPVYLSYMGSEAYGLIGFFTMMTAWFQLLDVGLTPTLARETARFRAGAIRADHLRAFLRALEVIFGGLSSLGAVLLVLLANAIATRWLRVQHLPVDEVGRAVMLMGLTVPLRWMSGLYRGVINGFERQVWLGAYTAGVTTARFFGVLAVFAVWSPLPSHFFAYQLCVAAAELAGLCLMTYRLVHRGTGQREKFSWTPLSSNLVFSLTIAFTTTVWIVITQTDKLILSNLLPLASYGVFSIAIVAAGGINALGGPLAQALLPRLTKLVAEGDEGHAFRLYGHATQVLCVVVGPAVVLLTFFARPILFAWTGHADIADNAAPILRLYAAGNGFASFAALAYYLQYAKGDLRLHFIGNALVLAALVPLFAFGARHGGGTGTGIAWVTVNGLYALGWIPLVHARLFKGRHWRWLLTDVAPIVIPTVTVGWALASLLPGPSGRATTLVFITAMAAMLLFVAAAMSGVVRGQFAIRLEPSLGLALNPQKSESNSSESARAK